MPEDEKKGQVFYAAGWKPEPYEPREASWADDSKHVKLSDYQVIVNDGNGYSWKLQCSVTGKDYKSAWSCEEADVLVSVEDGCLVLKKPDEETGAYLKLPKMADASSTPHVDKTRCGVFVTLPKVGAKAPPTPLTEEQLGTSPIVQMTSAPPLEDELKRIGEEQAAYKAKKAALAAGA